MCVCPVQLSRSREAELRDEVVSLRQEKKELQYNMCLLEEDNQGLREEIQHLRGKTLLYRVLSVTFKILQRQHGSAFYFLDGSNESEDVMTLGRLTSEEAEPRLTARRDSRVEEQLRNTQEKLQLKEREVK